MFGTRVGKLIGRWRGEVWTRDVILWSDGLLYDRVGVLGWDLVWRGVWECDSVGTEFDSGYWVVWGGIKGKGRIGFGPSWSDVAFDFAFWNGVWGLWEWSLENLECGKFGPFRNVFVV